MIYTLFLYRTESDTLLYEKDLQQMSDERVEMFGSFLAALKSFISGLVLEGSKELKSIELGNYSITISHISEVSLEIVLVADKEDTKEVNKTIPPMIKIVLNHKELFINSKYDPKQFELFNQTMTEFLLSKDSLIDKSWLTKNQDEFLKSIWNQRGEISSQIRKDRKEHRKRLMEEKEELVNKFKIETNIIIKYDLSLKLIEVMEELKDDEGLIEYQKEEKILKDQIRDLKIKLNYYLTSTKKPLEQALSPLSSQYGIFKEVYLNFYSFSTKLKHVAPPEVYQKCFSLARTLSNLGEVNEFSPVITEIESLPDDVEKFLNTA